MKILIVGTGVIGTIYGRALAESGNEIIHYVRKGKKDNFKEIYNSGKSLGVPMPYMDKLYGQVIAH